MTEAMSGQQLSVAVAGATGGVGEGVTRALLSQGATVVALGRHQETLAELARRVDGTGPGRLVPTVCDVTSGDSGAVTSRVLEAAGGELDGVVISIGTSGSPHGGTVLDLTHDEVRSMTEVNEVGGWLALRGLVPAVRPDGAVVNLMGASAEIPFPGNPLMGSTNAAVRSLVTTLAAQLEATGPRVYALVIGVTRTRARQRAGIDDPRWLRGEDIGMYAAELVRGDVPRPRQALRYLLDPASGPQLTSPLLAHRDGRPR